MRWATLALLAVSCTTLDRKGGSLHVEPGETRVVREEVARRTVPMRWRELEASAMVLDGEEGAVRVRFPRGGGGLGLAILRGETPLAADGAVVEATRFEDGRLYPIARLRLEGSRWRMAPRRREGDPAPGRDLLDEVKDNDGRFRLATGVQNVVGSRFSTFELAAVRRSGGDVPDWQERARDARVSGRVERVEGCTAILREHAFGARRGKHFWELPLLDVLLAGEVLGDRDERRWEWSGVVAIGRAAPGGAEGPARALPAPSMELVTVRDRSYRHGPGAVTGAVLRALAYAGAWLVEKGLQWTPEPDGWGEWFWEWRTGGRGKAHGSRRSGSP